MTEAEAAAWRRRFEREREARKVAEDLLHDKSRELFAVNQALAERVAELAMRAEVERGVARFSATLARCDTRAELVAILRDTLVPLLACDRISLAERLTENTLRMTRVFVSRPREEVWPLRTLRDDAPFDAAIQPGSALEAAVRGGVMLATPAVPADTYPDWRLLRDQLGLRHFAILPLLDASGVLGTLNVSWCDPTAPSPARLADAQQLANVLTSHFRAVVAREALAALNAELEATVARRTAELRASEERLAQLFEYAPQPTLMVDDGRVVQANRGAVRLFGSAVADVVGREVRAFLPEGFDNERGAEAPLERALAGIRADGSRFLARTGAVRVGVGGRDVFLVGVTDVTEMVEAQSALHASLDEKVTLLKEIHHRVKNNLQIISSLLNLQQDGLASEPARAALQESVFRVRSMALVHQSLYGVESLDRVDLHEYALRLTASLQGMLAPRTRVVVHPSSVVVGIDEAVPVGLVLNELVTNALKYGQPEDTAVQARVDIDIDAVGADYVLRVRDNGAGVSAEVLQRGRGGLGTQLVLSLARQLRGKVSAETEGGAVFSLRWPQAGASRKG